MQLPRVVFHSAHDARKPVWAGIRETNVMAKVCIAFLRQTCRAIAELQCIRRTGMPLALLLAACCSFVAPSAMAVETRNVLILYSNSRQLPSSQEADRGLREAIATSPERTVQFFEEFLGRPAFSDDAVEQATATYLRDKYAQIPPEAIVAIGAPALDFILKRRRQVFADVPVIHLGVEKSNFQKIQPLPADVVGVPVDYDFSATVELALRLHPRTRRVVVVTGAGVRDRIWETELRADLARLEIAPAVEYLAGLPTDAVMKRVRELEKGDVVFTPGYFVDGTGRSAIPRELAARIAAESSAPVYAPFATYIGIGVVGGWMPSFVEMGRQAANALNALLDGTAPAALRLPASTSPDLHVDWRQVRKWDIDPDAIPTGAIVHFREATFWEMHRNTVIIAIAVILLQAGLISALLIQNRRRHRAERQVREDRSELAHLSRVTVLGALSSSLAHELNQPLTAISTNTFAALALLANDDVDLGEVRAILRDIAADDERAGEVIVRLRDFLRKGETQREMIEINTTVQEVIKLVSSDLSLRNVAVTTALGSDLAPITADRVQIQQVLINLVLNAADALQDADSANKVIVIRTEGQKGERRAGIGARRRPGHFRGSDRTRLRAFLFDEGQRPGTRAFHLPVDHRCARGKAVGRQQR